MPPSPPLALQLRRLWLRSFSFLRPTSPPPIPSPAAANLHPSQSSTLSLFTSPSLFLARSFSALSEHADPTAQSISNKLLEDPNSDPLSVTQRLHLAFSHLTPSPQLVLQTLNISHDAGRTALGFYNWLLSNPNFTPDDLTLSHFVHYFGRRKDFTATHEALLAGRNVVGPKTLEAAIDRLVRAGRPTQAVSFFEIMEKDYGLKRDRDSLGFIVEKLCENGYASYAEKMVKNVATEFFPDERICDLLIRGWCVDGKLDEATRLAAEMHRGGFELGTSAYNAILDCVCKLCRKKDPFRLDSEAEKVLVDMDYNGVPRNVETFNVLISNLCKIRRTEDAMKLFYRIGEWGCLPDANTFLILTNSLYQAARLEEGDEMIDRMKSAGFGEALDKKAYYQFLKILCGIERIDHALGVFGKMKADGLEPGIKTYDLLMGKLCAHNRVEKANALFTEAQRRGVPVTPKAYKVEARFMKKPKAVKTEKKKRETLPEKMARKRRRLKQIRLSFVKKPKRMMGRA